MISGFNQWLGAAIVLMLVAPAPAQGERVTGQAATSADKPATTTQHDRVLREIAGAQVLDEYRASFDSAYVPVGPILESQAPGANVIALSGSLTQRAYQLPEDVPKARALRFYRKELRDKGFEIIFACRGELACGTGFGHYIHEGGPVINSGLEYVGYAPFAAVTARLQVPAPGPDVVAFIYLGKHDRHRMFQQLVEVVHGPEGKPAASRQGRGS